MIYLELFWAFFQIGLFSFGGGYGCVMLGEGILSSVQGKMSVGFTEQDGVICMEIAMPRDQVVREGENGFVGHAEYSATVQYSTPGETVTKTSEIVTRTTPMYQNKDHECDVFYLAAGTPAPAPSLVFPENTEKSIWTLQKN